MNVTGKISVIMAIYNCAQYLSEAINSILNQTYTNWELILCDDASTDETYQVATEYKKRYPNKIILIQNEKNSKLSYSLNHCLKYATGEYVARMDGDDICAPERFEKQVNYLKAHPEYQVVGTDMQHFNEHTGMADVVKSVANPNYYSLRNHIPYHHATIMTYKFVYDKVGGYTVSERTVRAQDYDLWFRFYHEGFNGNNIHEPLYFMREDVNAIRRRTFKVRWNALKTTYIGYKLLGYPKWWLIRPTFMALYKSLIPFGAVEMYRNWQARHKEK